MEFNKIYTNILKQHGNVVKQQAVPVDEGNKYYNFIMSCDNCQQISDEELYAQFQETDPVLKSAMEGLEYLKEISQQNPRITEHISTIKKQVQNFIIDKLNDELQKFQDQSEDQSEDQDEQYF